MHSDNEATAGFGDEITQKGLERTKSGHIEWRKDHSEYPRQWPIARKTFDTAIIVFFEFYT